MVRGTISSCTLCGKQGDRDEFGYTVFTISHRNVCPAGSECVWCCSECWATLYDSMKRQWKMTLLLLNPKTKDQ